jgi:N-acetylglutamate synthase-like GNAT family acetyltransferase
MKIISVREEQIHLERIIEYFQRNWKSVWPVIYEDCIGHSILSDNPLPQWYVLEKDGVLVGCAGLITNDFISRMDLYPWICALFVEEEHRGHEYGLLLIEKAKADARKAGFDSVYLSTDHIGYYEKYGFEYVGQGYHPWKEESRIYRSIV